jgi:L-cystine uptake protein TcyP (sodium:dicarboxylate symporter family)
VKAGMTVAIIGIAILVISTVGATLWVKRSESGRQRQVKILLFALYFWVLVFVQLILVSLGYSVLAG